jgi:hypothetical protein
VQWCGSSHHAEELSGSLVHLTGVACDEVQLPHRVGLLELFGEPCLAIDARVVTGHCVLCRRDQEVHLVGEHLVHGRYRDARPGGDVFDAGTGEALFREHRRGGIPNSFPRLGRLLLSPRRTDLDRSHLGIVSLY